MFCPHEQRKTPFNSHSRAWCLRSSPVRDSIIRRAWSTSLRGRYAGTGTAIQSFSSRVLTDVRVTYRLPLSPSVSESYLVVTFLRLYHQIPQDLFGSSPAATSGDSSGAIS